MILFVRHTTSLQTITGNYKVLNLRLLLICEPTGYRMAGSCGCCGKLVWKGQVSASLSVFCFNAAVFHFYVVVEYYIENEDNLQQKR